MIKTSYKIIFLLFLSVLTGNLEAQDLKKLNLSSDGQLLVKSVEANYGKTYLVKDLPVISYLVDSQLKTTTAVRNTQQGDSIIFTDGNLQISYKTLSFDKGIKARILFKNISLKDTISIRNVVPFGENPDHVYITGKGDHELSRSHLFRPGYEPVNVILPDNAWELGFSAFNLADGKGICGLTRRTAWDKAKAQRHRFETLLFPGGSVTYSLWADLYNGNWQEGLRIMFQDRFLYDVNGTFDNTLFERDDLKWIRHAYAMHLIMN